MVDWLSIEVLGFGPGLGFITYQFCELDDSVFFTYIQIGRNDLIHLKGHCKSQIQSHK